MRQLSKYGAVYMKGEVNSNRFDFTSVPSQILVCVYMTGEVKSEVKLTSPPYFTSVKLTEVKSQCGLKYSCKRYTRSELKSLQCFVNKINVKILVTRVYFCYHICFALQLISRAGCILSRQLWVKK